jgi:hypothetical protein
MGLFGEPRVAMCPRCPDAVLVGTMAFSHAEFYCLECGGKFGFLQPRPEKETPELLERMEAAREEFALNAGHKLLVNGGYLDGCERCQQEPHTHHATDDERAAHTAALEWLANRVKEPV